MDNFYLTPTLTGQYCSSVQQGPPGSPTVVNPGQNCQLTAYAQNQNAPNSQYQITTKQNSSDGSTVTYCYNPTLIVANATLCASFQPPSGGSDSQNNWAQQSIGCFQCVSQIFVGSIAYNVLPTIMYNQLLGVYVNDCLLSSKTNSNQICSYLNVYDQTQQACVACNSLLQMCLQCSDTRTCTICQAGYRPVQMKDSNGLIFTSCLWNFCGYDTKYQQGITSDCLTCNIKYCLTCQILTNNNTFPYTQAQSCTQCAPGYYQIQTGTLIINSVTTIIYSCSQKITTPKILNYFVFTQDQNLNPVSNGDGTTYDTAFKFLAQAINTLYSQNLQQYTNITATIWVGQGVHHWFFCPSDAQSTFTSTCNNPNMKFTYPSSNNVRLFVKPLDCSTILEPIFSNINNFGTPDYFYGNCTNLSSGQKPQIRVQSNYSYFNVTNFAQFENLVFTGIDMLAVDNSGNSACGYSYMPIQKCGFDKKPTAKVQNLYLNKLSSLQCNYSCKIDGYLPKYFQYNPNSLLDFDSSNTNCQANSGGVGGTYKCDGTPYNPNYFTQDQNGYMQQRHTILFNLFTFDGINSKTVIRPTLNLFNCEFNYFLTSTESLINIETDSIWFTGSHPLDKINSGTIYDGVMIFMGIDAGANISISNSTFSDSKFCKGLIVYRQQQPFNLAKSSRVLNMTNFGGIYPKNHPKIQINNSIFNNLGFTDTLLQVTLIEVLIQKLGGIDVESMLTYQPFYNKGLVINIVGWGGPIQIQDSQFTQNMINIPGLAYQEFDISFVPYTLSTIRANPVFYQNFQLYCWGKLLPKININTDLHGFTESFNIIYLADMTQNITVDNCLFDSNIAFDGIIHAENIGTLSVTNTRFKNNMSYTSSNAIAVYDISYLMVDQSYFQENSGWFFGQGGAIGIYSSTNALIQNSSFYRNYAGHQGSAIHSDYNQNVSILANYFQQNGPIFSTTEATVSPYYSLLQASNRTSVYYDNTGKCQNEFYYLQFCTKSMKNISLSQSQGSIYISASTSDTASTSQTIIQNNNFYDNQASPIINTTYQQAPQASCIMIQGNTITNITKNQFGFHQSDYEFIIQIFCPILFKKYSNTSYWSYSHAPLIKMETSEVTITENNFTNNYNWQVNMMASLVEFRSTVKTTGFDDIFYVNSNSQKGQNQQNQQGQGGSQQQGGQQNGGSGQQGGGSGQQGGGSGQQGGGSGQQGGNSGQQGGGSGQQSGGSGQQGGNSSGSGNQGGGQSNSGQQNGQNSGGSTSSSQSGGGQQGGSNNQSGGGNQGGSNNNPPPKLLLRNLKEQSFLDTLLSQYSNRVYFSKNNVVGNIFNSFDNKTQAGYIYITDSMALIINNSIQFNGNKQFGNPMVSVENGAAFVEENIFNHLYCQVACLLQLNAVTATQVTNNLMTFMVGGSFYLNSSSLILQNQVSNATFDSIGNLYNNSNMIIYNCSFYNSWGDSGAVLQIINSTFNITYSLLQRTLPHYVNKTQLIQSTYKGKTPLSYLISDSELIYINSIFAVSGQILASESDSESFITYCQFIDLIGDAVTVLNFNFATVTINAPPLEDQNSTNSSQGNRILFLDDDNDIIQSNNRIRQLQSVQSYFSNITYVGYGFFGNQALTGSLFQILGSQFQIEDIEISNSTVSSSILQATQSNLIIQNANLSNNIAGKYGILYTTLCQDGLNVTVTNSTISNNSGKLASIITSINSEMYFDEVQFIGNQADFYSIMNTQSTMVYNNTLFDSNYANQISNGFYMVTYAQVILYNTIIQNSINNQVATGFFSLMINSDLQILDNCVINNIKSQGNGLISSESGSLVTIANNVQITSCSSNSQVIQINNSPNFTIQNAYFAGFTPSLIIASQSNVYISDSNFTDSKGNLLQVDMGDKISLNNVNMYNSSDPTQNGHGFLCIACSDVSIQNCTFSNLTSNEGGALNIESDVLSIQNSIFQNNNAKVGGAIYLTESGPTIINGSTFYSNNASTNGGAILYECHQDLLNSDCKANLTQNNFTLNNAILKGGALNYISSNFTLVDQNKFQNNTSIYGSILGSFPYYLQYQANNLTQNIYANSSQNNLTQLTITPGHLIEITITIYDLEGRVYVGEDSAVARLQFNDLATNYYITGDSAVAQNGVFLFNNLRVQMQTNTTSFINLHLQNLDNYGNQISFILNDTLIYVTSLLCVDGEHFTPQQECVPCGAGYYLINVLTPNQQCLVCQQTAYCYGGNNTVPRPGYWRESIDTDIFYPCLLSDACLGGSQYNPYTLCEEGYEGILCSLCTSNFYRIGFFRCYECSDKISTVILFACNVFALFLLIILLQRSQMTHLQVPKPRLFVYYKIMINHVQIMGIICQLNFQWGQSANWIMFFWESFARIPLNAVSPPCILQQFMGVNNEKGSQNRIIYFNMILSAVGPWIIMLFVVCFWTLRLYSNKFTTLKEHIFSTLAIVIFLFQPTVMEFVFKSLFCQDALNDGSRLIYDLEQFCFQGNHLIILIVLTIPSLLFWLYGWPLIIYKGLKNGKAKQEGKNKWNDQDNHLIKFKLQYSFISGGYQSSESIWDIFQSYKIILTLFIVLLASTSQKGTLTFTLILMTFLSVYLTSSLRVKPYYTLELNQMDILSTVIQIETLFLGLFVTDQQNSSDSTFITTQSILFILLIISYSLFLIVFYLRLRIEILKWIFENEWNSRFVIFFRTLFFGPVSKQAFMIKYMSGDKIFDQELSNNIQNERQHDSANIQSQSEEQSSVQDESQFESSQNIADSSVSLVSLNSITGITLEKLKNGQQQQNQKPIQNNNNLIPPDDQKIKQVQQSTKLLPQPESSQGKPIAVSDQKLKLNLLKLGNRSNHLGQQDEEGENDSDVTKRTFDRNHDVEIKNSVTTITTNVQRKNELKGSENDFSQSAITKAATENQQNQDKVNQRSFSAMTDRSGKSTFRKQQNFNYKDEIEFQNENTSNVAASRYKSKSKNKAEKNNDDDEFLDENDDPFGMLSKRSKLKQNQNKYKQKPVVAQSQNLQNPNKKNNFDSTFGNGKLKLGKNLQNEPSSSESESFDLSQDGGVQFKNNYKLPTDTQKIQFEEEKKQVNSRKNLNTNVQDKKKQNQLIMKNLSPKNQYQQKPRVSDKIENKSSQSSIESENNSYSNSSKFGKQNRKSVVRNQSNSVNRRPQTAVQNQNVLLNQKEGVKKVKNNNLMQRSAIRSNREISQQIKIDEDSSKAGQTLVIEDIFSNKSGLNSVSVKRGNRNKSSGDQKRY